MSTVGVVKAKLVEVLTAALPNVQVIYGPAASVTTTTSRVLTVGRVVGTRDLDSISIATTAEQYAVELLTTADNAGTSQQTTTEQAVSDYTAAELAIREHPTAPELGLGPGVTILPTGEFELMEQADSDGRHAAVRFTVQVYASNT